MVSAKVSTNQINENKKVTIRHRTQGSHGAWGWVKTKCKFKSKEIITQKSLALGNSRNNGKRQWNDALEWVRESLYAEEWDFKYMLFALILLYYWVPIINLKTRWIYRTFLVPMELAFVHYSVENPVWHPSLCWCSKALILLRLPSPFRDLVGNKPWRYLTYCVSLYAKHRQRQLTSELTNKKIS